MESISLKPRWPQQATALRATDGSNLGYDRVSSVENYAFRYIVSNESMRAVTVRVKAEGSEVNIRLAQIGISWSNSS